MSKHTRKAQAIVAQLERKSGGTLTREQGRAYFQERDRLGLPFDEVAQGVAAILASKLPHRQPTATTIEVTAEDGRVHITIDRIDAMLDPEAADDLIHAVLEAREAC